MLIIRKEPLKTEKYDVVAVNLNTIDEIIIIRNNNRFGLSVLKHHDGHFSNHSYLSHTLDNFDSYQSCLELLQKLCEALESGKKVFDLRVTDQDPNPRREKDHTGVV